MASRIWILGASDPEMAAIESLLRACNEEVAYATMAGHRVAASEAYHADCTWTDTAPDDDPWDEIITVECEATTRVTRRIDHHRPGDPGYGVAPEDFMRASSLGQVISELASLGLLPVSWTRWSVPTKRIGNSVGEIAHYSIFGRFLPQVHGYYVTLDRSSGLVTWDASDDELRCPGSHRSDDDRLIRALIPATLVLTAAADHCLGAAYAGRCPGVDPDALMRWRVESRAKFQERSVDEILSDIAAAHLMLKDRSTTNVVWLDPGECSDPQRSCCNGPTAVDMRGMHVPELPEAGTRYGIAYVADGLPGPDGRRKVVCSGPSEVIRAFLQHFVPREGLLDPYGDPARGFAGAYYPG